MIGSVKRIVRNLGYPSTKLTQINHIFNSIKKKSDLQRIPAV